MKSIRCLFILISILTLPIAVSAQSLDAAKIDQALGRPGQKIGDVYKLGFPRTGLHVSVHGLAIRPGHEVKRCSDHAPSLQLGKAATKLSRKVLGSSL
jgi:hypothetical protein